MKEKWNEEMDKLSGAIQRIEEEAERAGWLLASLHGRRDYLISLKKESSISCQFCGVPLVLPPDEEIQVALRLYREYLEWKAEWNGDEPAMQEWMEFDDWLEWRK